MNCIFSNKIFFFSLALLSFSSCGQQNHTKVEPPAENTGEPVEITAGRLVGSWFAKGRSQNGVQFLDNGRYISFEPLHFGEWKLKADQLLLTDSENETDTTASLSSYKLISNPDESITLRTSEGQDSISLTRYDVKIEFDKWLGYWRGVEGLALIISPADTHYRLHIFSMESDTSFDATPTAQGLKFSRDGMEEVLRKGSGYDTGLKYLADKNNCLFIKEGEGFCRD